MMTASPFLVTMPRTASLLFVLLNCLIPSSCFLNWKSSDTRIDSVRTTTTMRWLFGKGTGALGGIGAQGEYYYIPSKKSTLKAPENVLGKERVIPLFPRNQVLGPLGEEYLGVYEMRYRQLLNDVGEGGVFGHVYYSQENSKIALVGTLARIKRTERLDDGGIYVVMEGIGRFYTRDVIAEKPYLKARVQVFKDYSENEQLADVLEQNVLSEVRYSVKLMKLLYPQNNYTMNNLVLQYRPPLLYPGVRTVSMQNKEEDMARRSKFSFTAIDMLKVDPVSKLLFLQEPIIEKRFSNVLKVLDESIAFLEGELLKRGVITEEGVRKLKKEALEDMSDLDNINMKSWLPENYLNGNWKMKPSLMD